MIPLSADEAYYWVWSQIPSLSFFDHPPFVSYLFQIGNFFSSASFFQRIPSILMGHCTIFIWAYLLKDILETKLLLGFLMLCMAHPLLGVGSLVVTPDIPLMFFWSLCVLALVNIVSGRHFLWSVMFGLCLGLGFLSKYHMALFAMPALVAISHFRQNIQKILVQLFLTIVFFFLGSLPLFIWNFENNFISFKFQFEHGLVQQINPVVEFCSYALGAILLSSPYVFKLFHIKKWFSRSTDHPFKQLRFVFWLSSISPLLFFAFTSLKGHVELNWPIMAFPSLIGLFLYDDKIRLQLKTLSVFWAFLSLVTIAAIYRSGQIQNHSWMNQLVQDNTPLYGGSYQTASFAWYYSKKPVYKLTGASRFDHFDLLPQSIPHDNLIYVLMGPNDSLPTGLPKSYEFKEFSRLNNNYTLLRGVQK